MVLRCLAAAALLVLTSCRSTDTKKSGASLRPVNVVLVTMDTLRADRPPHVG